VIIIFTNRVIKICDYLHVVIERSASLVSARDNLIIDKVQGNFTGSESNKIVGNS